MRKLLFLLFLITHASIYFQPAYASTLPTIPYVEFEIQVHTIEPILRAIENQKSLDSKLNLIYFYIRKYNKKQIIAEKEGIVGLANYYDKVIHTLYNNQAIQHINMVSMGDSNTFGVNLTIDQRYSNKLAVGANIVVRNIGTNGYKVADLISTAPTQLYPKKDTTKRNVVTIMIGTNDFIAGNTVVNTWTQLQILVANVKVNGWEPWIITYPPKMGDTTVNTSIVAYNNLIKANTSLGYSVVDAYKEFSDGANGNKVGLMQADGLHMTDIGNSIVYDRLEKSLGLEELLIRIMKKY